MTTRHTQAKLSLPYDLVFIAIAAVVLLAGLLLLRLASSPSAASSRNHS